MTNNRVFGGCGMISHAMNELEVKCKPSDLPEFIEIDLETLELEHAIHLSEVKLPKGVELAHAVDSEHDHPVVAVQKPKGAGKLEDDALAAEGTAEAKSE